MTGSVLTCADLIAGLNGAAEATAEAEDRLGVLDGIAGDGDLGVTLSTGFAAVRSLVLTEKTEDCGELLVHAAGVLGREAPSTLGTLLSMALKSAGESLRGKAHLGPSDLAALLEVAAEAIRRRGRVEKGQRTVLDALGSSAEAARSAADAGHDVNVVLDRAVAAAAAGAAATASMDAVVGRAGWLSERARGHPDAGATAWATLLEGFARGIRELPPGPRNG